jgi:hypothetical protein
MFAVCLQDGTTLRLSVPAFLLLVAGCTGAIGSTSSGGDEVPPGAHPDDRSGDGTGASGGTASACPPRGEVAVGPAPLRRLTHREFNNTVRDLLGDDSNPADNFPPELAVHGFDTNVTTQAVTFALASDYLTAAETMAAKAVANLSRLSPCDVGSKGAAECARMFIRDVGKRAYRRPLTEAEVSALFTTYDKGRTTVDHVNGLRLSLIRMLLSPHFLYRPDFGDVEVGDGVRSLSSHETATRLSYLLWGTMPDDQLFDAAAAGALRSEDEIAAQVARMLADQRARPTLRAFYSGWLQLDHLGRAVKDDKLFPGFAAMIPALTEEVTRLVDEIAWGEGGALADLFTSDFSFMNRDLAGFLGLANDRMSSGFERVSLAPRGQPGPAWRAGILTTPGLLAAHAKAEETSPILRGRFVAEQILCMQVPLPPADVPLVPPAQSADLTTRERFEEHSQSECASCHKLMDPLGFAFENFDAAGRFRDRENGKPIDASGTLVDTDVDGAFANGIELSALLASSQQMRSCVALQFLRFALGREESEGDERTLSQLACGVRDEATGLLDVVDAFTRSDGFRHVASQAGATP